MARTTTSKKINLKDGFYLAVHPGLGTVQSSILIRRDTKEEIKVLMKTYGKSKSVSYYGEVRNSRLIE
jgi:hypothetical protein